MTILRIPEVDIEILVSEFYEAIEFEDRSRASPLAESIDRLAGAHLPFQIRAIPASVSI